MLNTLSTICKVLSDVFGKFFKLIAEFLVLKIKISNVVLEKTEIDDRLSQSESYRFKHFRSSIYFILFYFRRPHNSTKTPPKQHLLSFYCILLQLCGRLNWNILLLLGLTFIILFNLFNYEVVTGVYRLGWHVADSNSRLAYYNVHVCIRCKSLLLLLPSSSSRGRLNFSMLKTQSR